LVLYLVIKKPFGKKTNKIMKNNLKFYKNIIHSDLLIECKSTKEKVIKVKDLYSLLISIKQLIRTLVFIFRKSNSLLYLHLQNTFLKTLFLKLITNKKKSIEIRASVLLPRLYKTHLNKIFIGFETDFKKTTDENKKLFKNNFFIVSSINSNFEKTIIGRYKINADIKNLKHLSFFSSLINQTIKE